MIPIGGKWGGLDDALRSIQALGDEIATERVLQPSLVAAGKELRDEIARTAPRSTDNRHMADEFVVIPDKAGAEFGRTTVLVGPRGSYPGFVAPFVEFGTSKMAPRPFVRPAYDAFEPWFPTMLADHLRRKFSGLIRKYNKQPRKAKA